MPGLSIIRALHDPVRRFEHTCMLSIRQETRAIHVLPRKRPHRQAKAQCQCSAVVQVVTPDAPKQYVASPHATDMPKVTLTRASRSFREKLASLLTRPPGIIVVVIVLITSACATGGERHRCWPGSAGGQAVSSAQLMFEQPTTSITTTARLAKRERERAKKERHMWLVIYRFERSPSAVGRAGG